MCGGHTKSSIFQMHSCSDGEQVATDAAAAATTTNDALTVELGKLQPVAQAMQNVASDCQERLGKAGDVAASDLMQQAKVVAVELSQSVVEGTSVSDALSAKIVELNGATPAPGSTDHAAVQATDAIVEELERMSKAWSDIADTLTELRLDVEPNLTGDAIEPLFYKIMYFVDKTYQNETTTCSGDLLDRPIMGKTSLECGRICDRRGQECKGFSYYPQGICFLMKKIKTVRYYTECEADPAKLTDFKDASCNVRFSDYQGTDISPTSKKCTECLKEVEEASGCRLGA